MGLIDDLKNAIDNYETDNCRTEIVDFTMSSGQSVLNVNEGFMFRIKVTNQSHLDMRSVKVRAIGTSYADVGLFPPMSGYSSYVISGAFNLDAHQSYTTGYFSGKAKAVTNGVKDIVTARIESWDANLEHILIDHTGAGAAEGKLSKDIQPD